MQTMSRLHQRRHGMQMKGKEILKIKIGLLSKLYKL